MNIFGYNLSKQKPVETVASTPAPTIVETITSTPTFITNEMFAVNFAAIGPTPTVKVERKADYYSWKTDDGSMEYPKFIEELYTSSTIHQGIINRKSGMLTGAGFTILNSENLEPIHKNSLDTLLRFSDGSNPLEDILTECGFNYQLYGAFAIELVYNNDHSKIVRMRSVNPGQLKAGEKIDGRVCHYYYSDDWTVRKPEFTMIPTFDVNDKDSFSQILYVKRSSVGQDVYGTPSYSAAIRYIQLEKEVSNYWLSAIQNGFAPSMSIIFKRTPKTDEDRKAIQRSIVSSFSGSTNAGKVLIMYADSPETAPEITPLQSTNLSDQYNTVVATAVDSICTAHSVVNPSLFGIKTAGSLGSSAELIEAYTIFNRTVIEPDRRILERAFNQIFEAGGYQGVKLSVNEFNPVKELTTQPKV